MTWEAGTWVCGSASTRHNSTPCYVAGALPPGRLPNPAKATHIRKSNPPAAPTSPSWAPPPLQRHTQAGRAAGAHPAPTCTERAARGLECVGCCCRCRPRSVQASGRAAPQGMAKPPMTARESRQTCTPLRPHDIIQQRRLPSVVATVSARASNGHLITSAAFMSSF